jgi:hypothetical protein
MLHLGIVILSPRLGVNATLCIIYTISWLSSVLELIIKKYPAGCARHFSIIYRVI